MLAVSTSIILSSMQMPISSRLLLPLLPHFCFFFLLLTLNNLAPVTGQCLDDQRALLLELKSELTFDSSTSQKLVRWNQTRDCCRWLGVECDSVGRVISLQLDGDSISGGLNGSSSLLRLLYLKKLNLAYNDFSGSQIPRGIHHLLHLEHLNLSRAGFGGDIPIELSLLKRLLVLDLSFQSFFLKIEHPSWKAVVQNLTRLREVHLDGVDVSAAGSEWSMPITSSLPHLSILSLRGCMLSGPFHPSLPQLHSLSVLQLDRNNLSSAIPDSYANFSSLTTFTCQDCSLLGSLPKMLLQLPTLQNLDLSSNLLLGGAISPQIPLSRALRSIHMSSCSFDGAFPSTLGNLTELVSLDLSFNHLTGSIPSLHMLKKLTDIDLSWNSLKGEISVHHFDGLSNLVFVSLQQNSLSGTIPHNLFALPSLQQLDLSYNQFSGQVNEFSISKLNISSLEYLLLSNNQLQGTIPNSLSLLQSLLLLDLSYNNFNSTFQLEKLQMLPTLSDLYLSYNNLSVDASNISSSTLHGIPQLRTLSLASCNLREFPDFIKHQSSLELLDLSNNRIAGDIPNWIWEVGNGTLMRLNLSRNLLDDLQKPYHIPTSLDRLDLHSNQLKGEFPPLPPSAQHVDYSNNYFSHPIPPTFFTSNIYYLSLASNRLTGAIPTSLCNATILEVLDLSFNNLSSTIPPCVAERMQHLRVLSLRGNNINGAIPSHFSVNCSLRTLDLSDNNLGGKIPKSLANCESLAVLNVGYNNFHDSFPCMLSPSLHVLLLRSNKFHGGLRCEKSWPNLQIVDVSSNDFNGSLHLLNFSTWRGMMIQGDGHLRPNHSRSNLLGSWYSSYQDEVTLIIKGLEMNLSKIWPEFTSIDLSSNKFQGDIPDAIGDLTSLYLLNLSHNALTGTIPKSLGALTELGALDLSENRLRGGIPEELARLTFLSILNVSYNELVGMIPTGPQFRTFEADSFEGNAGLCGFPLNTSCIDGNDSNPPKEKEEDEDEEEIKWEYVCAALGYAVGLGSIAWILLFCRRFRDGYFGKIEEVVEEIFICRDGRRRRRRKGGVRNRVVRRQ